jgi:hypothetical protein
MYPSEERDFGSLRTFSDMYKNDEGLAGSILVKAQGTFPITTPLGATSFP